MQGPPAREHKEHLLRSLHQHPSHAQKLPIIDGRMDKLADRNHSRHEIQVHWGLTTNASSHIAYLIYLNKLEESIVEVLVN
jgi:hypothetical protein